MTSTWVAACADGIPYWDTGAPDSAPWRLGSRASDPFNDRTGRQLRCRDCVAGTPRLGHFLDGRGEDGTRSSGRTQVADALFDPSGPFLSQAESSRIAVALGLSLAERLGPCAPGAPHHDRAKGDYHAVSRCMFSASHRINPTDILWTIACRPLIATPLQRQGAAAPCGRHTGGAREWSGDFTRSGS